MKSETAVPKEICLHHNISDKAIALDTSKALLGTHHTGSHKATHVFRPSRPPEVLAKELWHPLSSGMADELGSMTPLEPDLHQHDWALWWTSMRVRVIM